MADTFSVKLPDNWKERWQEVEAAAGRYNFSLQKDGENIAFAGFGIEGDIRIDGNIAFVIIHKRPFFLSQALIEEKVRGFLLRQE